MFLGAVAQLGEHLLCKQGVVGSIPSGSTKHLVILCWSQIFEISMVVGVMKR